jgi:hypothetical protein
VLLSIHDHTSVHGQVQVAVSVAVEKGVTKQMVGPVLNFPVDGLLEVREYFVTPAVDFPQVEDVDSLCRSLLQKRSYAFSQVVTLGDIL